VNRKQKYIQIYSNCPQLLITNCANLAQLHSIDKKKAKVTDQSHLLTKAFIDRIANVIGA
jgi:hypothetical protein